jgi:hypothetical protein
MKAGREGNHVSNYFSAGIKYRIVDLSRPNFDALLTGSRSPRPKTRAAPSPSRHLAGTDDHDGRRDHNRRCGQIEKWRGEETATDSLTHAALNPIQTVLKLL